MYATASSTEEKNKLSTTAVRFCRQFSLAEIQLATGDFSDANLIGMGGFGNVYLGIIDNGELIVAIKRLASNSNQGTHEFFVEIETLSKLRHVNLVSLIGYSNEDGEMILVYEYIVGGTLADHLYKLSRNSDSDNCSSLTWKERLKICIGAGRGLDYLHTGSSIIHRDVKSTNILLDENLTAKVSDFGLAKHLSSGNSQSHVSTVVKGSFGYLDPSYFSTGRITRKSDTYAFGVVLLEVLCGRPAVDSSLDEDRMSLTMWAKEKISKGKVDEIVASNLRDEISTDSLKLFVGVAKRCLHVEPHKRPTMGEVVVDLLSALIQQERRAETHNASRFLPLNAFWGRAKPSGNLAPGSTKEDHSHIDVNTLSIAFPVRAIPLYELKVITNNFSSKYFTNDGFNGSVFCGVLKSGQAVVVKNVEHMPNKDFLSQVSKECRLKNENVAQLLGYSADGGKKFLAYEFAQNGTLHDILHAQHDVKGSEPNLALSWAQRVKIAVGAAKGLQYIHEKGRIHRNIKSSNVLIFDDEVAKIADYGLPTESPSKALPWYEDSVIPRRPRNLPPEYHMTGELSVKSDVYSFGVILLELLTGSKLIDSTRPRGRQCLVTWATPELNEDKVKGIVDARLNGDYPPKAFAKMAAVAGVCLQDDAEVRPDMNSVVKALHPLLDA